VDEPAIRQAGGLPNTPYLLGDSNIRICARDAVLSDLIWSAERGYPGSPNYRDFHDMNMDLGLQLSRVGDRSKPHKDPYDPTLASQSMHQDAQDFVRRLDETLRNNAVADRALAVIAIDTELLGHWWHEGVDWFTEVIEMLPPLGIESITLEQATSDPLGSIELGESSWGEGKDWRLWVGEPVRDIVVMNHQAQVRVLEADRSKALNSSQLSRLNNELFNLLSSDWAFMVSRDSAANYARGRIEDHFRVINLIIEGHDVTENLTPFQFHSLNPTVTHH
jgi:1,4-alpha-glucan branching enzyme